MSVHEIREGDMVLMGIAAGNAYTTYGSVAQETKENILGNLGVNVSVMVVSQCPGVFVVLRKMET